MILDKKRGGLFKFLKYSFYGVVLIGGSSLVYATWPRTEKPAGVDADESPAAVNSFYIFFL